MVQPGINKIHVYQQFRSRSNPLQQVIVFVMILLQKPPYHHQAKHVNLPAVFFPAYFTPIVLGYNGTTRDQPGISPLTTLGGVDPKETLLNRSLPERAGKQASNHQFSGLKTVRFTTEGLLYTAVVFFSWTCRSPPKPPHNSVISPNSEDQPHLNQP